MTTLATNAGSAYVYRRVGSQWKFEAELFADDGYPFAEFADSVAIHADTIVVGCPKYQEVGIASGKAYVFERDAEGDWSQAPALVPDDALAGDQFGRAVGVWGDTIAIGAPHADDAGDGGGKVYIFERGEDGKWSQADTLIPITVGEDHNFGGAIAFDDDALAIAAPRSDVAWFKAGAVYVYRRAENGQWIEEDTLVAEDPDSYSHFGRTIDISGDAVIVGSTDHGFGLFNDPGAAFIFHRDDNGQWQQAEKLEASPGELYGDFGSGVAIDADSAMVGARLDFTGDVDGVVYVYERDGASWDKVDTLKAGLVDDCYAHRVAMDAGTTLVSARCDDEGAFEAGAVYVYSQDCPADMNSDGFVDVLDFVMFQQLWAGADARADCDGNAVFNVLDFVCYVDVFQSGCD